MQYLSCNYPLFKPEDISGDQDSVKAVLKEFYLHTLVQSANSDPRATDADATVTLDQTSVSTFLVRVW